MPQLMPLYWSVSLFVILFFIFMMVDFYNKFMRMSLVNWMIYYYPSDLKWEW